MSHMVERLKEIIQASNEEHVSETSFEVSEGDPPDPVEKPDQSGPSELYKRRMAHLAKLGEHVESDSRRRFMILQKAKVF